MQFRAASVKGKSSPLHSSIVSTLSERPKDNEMRAYRYITGNTLGPNLPPLDCSIQASNHRSTAVRGPPECRTLDAGEAAFERGTAVLA